MIYRTILFCFLQLLWITGQAQTDFGCDVIQYTSISDSSYDKTTVNYGKNIGINGDSVLLKMDIYTPATAVNHKRPLIIFAHGGSFIAGNRQTMDVFCSYYTSRGYITATIDYRKLSILNGIPSEAAAKDIVIKASHDMKAAIRWFKHSADQDNEYQIDKDMIFVGGYSAGAIMAILTGVLDAEDNLPSDIQQIIDNNGGLEGNSSFPNMQNYDSSVQGIINYSGAILDTAWIDQEDPAIWSFHGDEDETVNIDFNYVNMLGNPIIELHGSRSIHTHTEQLGVPGYLHVAEGGGHVDVIFNGSFKADRDIYHENTLNQLSDIICKSSVNTQAEALQEIQIIPNPIQDVFYLKGEFLQADIRIFNVEGQKVAHFPQIDSNSQMDISALHQGVYFVQIRNQNEQILKKIVKLK